MRILLRSLVKDLAQERHDPCLSLYLPTERAGREQLQNIVRLKNLLRTADRQLERIGQSAEERRAFLEPVAELPTQMGTWRSMSDGLAIFRARDFFLAIHVPIAVPELALLGTHFHLAPLMPSIQTQQRYYALTLSQDAIRLYAGDESGVQGVPLDEAREGLRPLLGLEKQEPSVQQHKTADGTLFHGHGAYKDHKKNDVMELLRLADKEVSALLHDEDAPLILVGSEPTLSLFRAICSYPHLLEEHVEGNAERWTDRELHERTWSLIQPVIQRRIRAMVERCRERKQPMVEETQEIIDAALEGRVETLFLRTHASLADRGRHVTAGQRPAEGDLFDVAALHTILHDGQVITLPPRRMPTRAPAAALLRRR